MTAIAGDALAVLLAVSRTIPNEDYVRYMEALGAVSALIAGTAEPEVCPQCFWINPRAGAEAEQANLRG